MRACWGTEIFTFVYTRHEFPAPFTRSVEMVSLEIKCTETQTGITYKFSSVLLSNSYSLLLYGCLMHRSLGKMLRFSLRVEYMAHLHSHSARRWPSTTLDLTEYRPRCAEKGLHRKVHIRYVALFSTGILTVTKHPRKSPPFGRLRTSPAKHGCFLL